MALASTNAKISVDTGKGNYLFPLILVTSLFFLWGLAYGLLDVLNKHFSRTTGSLGLSTSPKTNETLKEVINGQIQRQEYQLQFQNLDRYMAI